VLQNGDLSVLSFHATKVFNTFEGGAIVCPDARTKQRIDHLKNFGFVNETTVVATGINGKMSELNAALGLLQLQHIDQAIERRATIDALYRERLSDLPGCGCWPRRPAPPATTPTSRCWSAPASRSRATRSTSACATPASWRGATSTPLISDFPMYRGLPSARPEGLPVARQAASEVLCLPIYPSLAEADLQRVVDVILQAADEGRRTQRPPAANATAQAVALAA
jgi:dTDP-4-amino-4,6-dideoxygalactose transaminase